MQETHFISPNSMCLFGLDRNVSHAISPIKDVCAKNFYNTDFFNALAKIRKRVTYFKKAKKMGGGGSPTTFSK